jgi:hypothetical protein
VKGRKEYYEKVNRHIRDVAHLATASILSLPLAFKRMGESLGTGKKVSCAKRSSGVWSFHAFSKQGDSSR